MGEGIGGMGDGLSHPATGRLLLPPCRGDGYYLFLIPFFLLIALGFVRVVAAVGGRGGGRREGALLDI